MRGKGGIVSVGVYRSCRKMRPRERESNTETERKSYTETERE